MRGADALARYVAGMPQLPQLTPLGQVFAYNNAAVVLAGHVIETVAGQPYEDVVRAQLLDPLGLDHTLFFSDEIVGYTSWRPRTPSRTARWSSRRCGWSAAHRCNPTGGLISSARDQLRYARFHLGDGRAPTATRC